jgi:Zn-dependent alcohol dehydrogenase
MAAKTVFFGTTFAFNDQGVDDVVKSFQTLYEGGADEAPFISYDSKNHVCLLSLYTCSKIGNRS